MPTIGIYIPIKVARAVARAYNIGVNDQQFLEVVRSVTAEALDDEAEIEHQLHGFHENCANANIHRRNRRCRMCGGSY